MSLPPYPEYYDSGVSWLGKLPNHWRVKRIKHTTYLKGRVGWKGLTSEEYLDSGYAYLVTGTDFSKKFISWQDCHCVEQARYEDDPFIQLCEGDLLITKDGTIGKLALVSNLDRPACLNSGIFLIRPKTDYITQYMYWVLQSEAFKVFCDLSSMGSTIQHLYQNVFEDFAFPIPELQEQRSIAAFLDREIAKIDALISAQEKLIALLAEKRQATLSHALTKGLDSNVPMKGSCVAWLGTVPEHWKVGKAGFYISVLPGYAFSSTGFSLDDSNAKLLRGINVGVGELKWDEVVYWPRTEADGLDAFKLEAGDVVIGMDRPLISSGMRVALVKKQDLPCLLLQRVAKIRPGALVDGRFIMRLLSSRAFEAHFAPETTGVSVPHISGEQIANFVIPVPPLEEQKRICNFLDAEFAKLDALTRESEKAILLFVERRAALISAAVTGQIDVRGARSQTILEKRWEAIAA